MTLLGIQFVAYSPAVESIDHAVTTVQRVIGANILPARVLRPTDKQAVERAFGAIQSLLLERLPGFKGVDVADRGADPQADAVLTIARMEHLIATWVVRIWQNRQLGEYALRGIRAAGTARIPSSPPR